jgi:hypothetical protein
VEPRNCIPFCQSGMAFYLQRRFLLCHSILYTGWHLTWKTVSNWRSLLDLLHVSVIGMCAVCRWEHKVKIAFLYPHGPTPSFLYRLCPDIPNIPHTAVPTKVDPRTAMRLTYTLTDVETKSACDKLQWQITYWSSSINNEVNIWTGNQLVFSSTAKVRTYK